MGKLYRQGDVLLQATDTIPANAKRQDAQGEVLIVERGEATGHHHAVLDREAELLVAGTAEAAQQFLRSHGTTMTHQEHLPVILPAGNYVRVPQMAYTPAEIVRQVD